MRRPLVWVTHPVTMIVAVHLAWTAGLVYWILFFLERYRQVRELAAQTGAGTQDLLTWAPLVVGIVLMGLIFAGTVALTLMLAKQAIINRQMRDFLSYVSHELRTPLTSISLTLETLRDHQLSPEQQRAFIDAMLEDTGRLSRQIGGILQASRLQRGRQPLRRELVQLDRFLKSFVAGRRGATRKETHRIEIVKLDYCSVLGDKEALRTVLENLVQNAERYSPAGSVIRLGVADCGSWAILSVEDEGIGINKKELKKVFNLFYRAEEGRAMSRRGSGLGLYIVKGIVTLHHGRVRVYSEGPGKGSRFEVLLPQVPCEGESNDENSACGG